MKARLIILISLIVAAGISPVKGLSVSDRDSLRATGFEDSGHTGSRLSISGNGRYFEDRGIPFFWLGDTAWELFHKLTLEEAEMYLRERARQQFNVIQAVVLAEMDGLRTPNRYGERPFVDDRFSVPNEKYFQHIDRVLDIADSLGLIMALLPTWGDKFRLEWGPGPVIFTAENTGEEFCKWLADRYSARDNIVWVLGGDRSPEGYEKIIDAMARGISSTAKEKNINRKLITYHPLGWASSSKWFHDRQWLAFNMQQTSHGTEIDRGAFIYKDYLRSEPKPVIDAEPIYEETPLDFDSRNGYSTDYHVRNAFYAAVFSGAAGHTYGCHAIWQFWESDGDEVRENEPLRSWQESLELPGARQMTYGKMLIEQFPVHSCSPGLSILRGENYRGLERISILRHNSNDYIMVYSGAGHPCEIDVNDMPAEVLRIKWFDPSTGSFTDELQIRNEGIIYLEPQNFEPGKDWVAVIIDEKI